MLGLVDQREFAHMQPSETHWMNGAAAQMNVPPTMDAQPQAASVVAARASPAIPQQRPLAPRRNMTAPRVQTRDKPYTRRKSSTANTFTNAHELALWESKMRNLQNNGQAGAGYHPNVGPAVQMTPIPMVQDYLLPSTKVQQQIQQQGHGHSLQALHGVPVPGVQALQGVAALQGVQGVPNVPNVPGVQTVQGAPGPGLLPGLSLASESNKSTSAQSNTTAMPPPLSPRQSPHSAHPSLVSQPLCSGVLGSAPSATNAGNGNGSFVQQQQPSVMATETGAATLASTLTSAMPANVPAVPATPSVLTSPQQHVTPQGQFTMLPETTASPMSVIHTPMYAYQPMEAEWASPRPSVTAEAAQWATLQPQYPQDVASVYTAPIFPVQSPASLTPANNPASVTVNDAASMAPFTPYGPYPSGQCTWYYYDPDNSPMPPPPVPVLAPAPSTNTAAATSIPTTEHPDPFPGALADAKGWYLLDLKTNLPFHVPFHPADSVPEPSAQLAARRALRIKTGKMNASGVSKAQSQSPQAPGRPPPVPSRSNSVPTLTYQPPTTTSPPADQQVTSPLTPPTPGSLSTTGAASDSGGQEESAMNFPTISPNLYYTNPAHMSSLFKRRKGKGP